MTVLSLTKLAQFLVPFCKRGIEKTLWRKQLFFNGLLARENRTCGYTRIQGTLADLRHPSRDRVFS
jgi:hypothetical protein